MCNVDLNARHLVVPTSGGGFRRASLCIPLAEGQASLAKGPQQTLLVCAWGTVQGLRTLGELPSETV